MADYIVNWVGWGNVTQSPHRLLRLYVSERANSLPDYLGTMAVYIIAVYYRVNKRKCKTSLILNCFITMRSMLAILKCSRPPNGQVFSAIKHKSTIVDGPQHLWDEVRLSAQHLSGGHLEAVQKSIQINSSMAHPHSLLVALAGKWALGTK